MIRGKLVLCAGMPATAKCGRVFVSHNKADVEVARSVGAHLSLAGLDVLVPRRRGLSWRGSG